MKTTSTKKNFVWYYVYQFVLLLSPLITTPYLSYTLGSEKIGIFSFTFSIANYLYVFAQLGTQSYGVREIVRARDNAKKMSKTFIEIELMTILTSAFCLIVFYIFIAFQTKYVFYYILWTLFILSATFDISWLYAGLEHFEEIFFRNIFFRIAGVIAVFLFVKSVNDLHIYILIYALTYLLSNMCMWTSISKYIVFIKPSFKNIFKHLKESFIYFIPAIAASVYVILDKSILGFVVEDKRESGYYEMTSNIITFGKSISSIVITKIFEPKTTYFYKHKNNKMIQNSIEISLDFTMFVGFGIIFGIFAVANRFVPVFFGTDFLLVEVLLKVMSPIIIITSITYVLEYEYLMPSGKRAIINNYVILGAIVNLILNLIFIRYFKSIGAIITSLIAEFIIMICFYNKSRGYIDLNLLYRTSYKKIVAGLVMYVYIYIITKMNNQYAIESDVKKLVFEVVSGIMIYVLVLYVLKDHIFNFKSNLEKLDNAK